MIRIPVHVQKYAESPVFTEDTVPEKLTTLHQTKSTVWGRICILSGELDYIIVGPPEKKARLNLQSEGIIKPEQAHRVEITGPVSFKVEFYK
ncbi:DUF1971 domain-containing protein [Robiginitomaculum antarcticum]|uniref:DUF1971 domain-containing protein n=1 Tax=Robiginitomaculum antarcticum TaxID=437507 RepID=UPI00035E9C20|nr:DUF1971 domain-containing protein [Robiginitomaculum antarcticum]